MLDKCDWSVFVGLSSCALGGIIVYCYKHVNWNLKALEEAEEYNVGDDLYEKVKSVGGTLPYVAISGSVSADDKSIHGVHSTETEGVIRNIVVKEHKSKWNSFTKSWYDAKQTISSTWKVEPFSLVIGDTRNEPENIDFKISVKDPLSARKLGLSVIADNYEPAGLSAGERAIEYVAGEHVKGIRTVEKMLVLNSAVTVIGEVKLGSDGQLVINAPSDGHLMYYITDRGLATVINAERTTMQVLKVVAIIFFLIGGGFGTFWLYTRYRKYLQDKQHIQSRREMEEFNENANADSHICSICLSDPRDVVFLPCGHICACSKCADKLNSCPVCRGSIVSRSTVYYS